MAPKSLRSTFSHAGMAIDDFVGTNSQGPDNESLNNLSQSNFSLDSSIRNAPNSHDYYQRPNNATTKGHTNNNSMHFDDTLDFGMSSDQLSMFTNSTASGMINVRQKEEQLSCSFCGLMETKCLVQCSKTKKWFCNSVNQLKISHILLHLVKSRNKEIVLHQDCLSGDATIECFACHCRNIFVLGFIPSLQGDKVIILCRSPCATNTNFRDDMWQVSRWAPLISERKLLSWLVEAPSEQAVQATRRVRMSQIQQLEDEWKAGNTHMTILDLDENNVQNSTATVALHPTMTVYESTQHYRQVMGPLIKIEAEYEKKLKESQSINNITVRWDIGPSSSGDFSKVDSAASNAGSCRKIAYFSLGDGNDDVKVLNGDELRLKLCDDRNLSKTWECNGIVVKVPNILSNEIGLELKEHKSKIPTNTTTGYSVEFVWKSAPFDRMKLAMRLFANNSQKQCVSHFLQEKLLGHEIDDSKGYAKVTYPTTYKVPNLSDLNSGQVFAINHVLRNSLTLIQGPPGTGKTITSAAVIYHLLKQKVSKRILVCAPSNIAVDHLAEKLHKIGLKIVRIAARSREFIESSVDFLMLNHQVEQFVNNGISNDQTNSLASDATSSAPAVSVGSEAAMNSQDDISQLLNQLKKLSPNNNILKSSSGQDSTLTYSQIHTNSSGIALNHADEKKRQKLLESIRKSFVSTADVVCCTCSNATPRKLYDLPFDTVLIDESTQAKDVECLVPIVNGCKKLILIGDHCQLGPIVLSKQAENAGLGQSLFERLLILSNKPHRLQVQYRMHPIIAQFPSNLFYEGSLQNGVSAEQRTIASVRHIFPEKDKPMFFYCSFGFEEIAGTGTSYLNRSEASQVLNLVTRFIKSGIHPKQIGIITPYEGQRSFIFQYMKHSGELNAKIYSEIEVSNVDSFQGREKDFIILSCVRSNEISSLGFLSDPRRLNVLITRSKYGLIIIGNPKALATNQLWHQLITFYKKMQLLVEGPLNSLKESFVPIPKPKKITISTSKQQISPSALNAKYLAQTAMLYPNQNLSTQLHMTPFNPNMPIPYSLVFSLPANCLKLQVHNNQRRLQPNSSHHPNSQMSAPSDQEFRLKKQRNSPTIDDQHNYSASNVNYSSDHSDYVGTGRKSPATLESSHAEPNAQKQADTAANKYHKQLNFQQNMMHQTMDANDLITGMLNPNIFGISGLDYEVGAMQTKSADQEAGKREDLGHSNESVAREVEGHDRSESIGKL